MIKNVCKSDTTNGHHSNRSQALSQFVVLGKKWFKKIKKLKWKLEIHAKTKVYTRT